jgi:hypothetical protein
VGDSRMHKQHGDRISLLPFFQNKDSRLKMYIRLLRILFTDDLSTVELDYGTILFLQSNVVSLAPNPQTGGPGPCIYVRQ